MSEGRKTSEAQFLCVAARPLRLCERRSREYVFSQRRRGLAKTQRSEGAYRQSRSAVADSPSQFENRRNASRL